MTGKQPFFIARTVKSFVIRAGRMTVAQEQAYDALWPVHGLSIQDGYISQARIFGHAAPLVLEIGFGMGPSLVAMAKARPDQNFIGVEVHPPGVGNVLKLIGEEGVSNLKIYRGDAKDVLDQCIADASLDKIQIFFPDPWHKKRHHKRRLIQADFVDDMRRKLKPGGVLHLATDWEAYAQQMMQVLSAAPGYRNRFGAGSWALEHERPETKFEQRGQRLGHGVWDLMFERVE